MSQQIKASVQFSSVQSLSHVRLFANPWIIAHQSSLSITNFQSSLKLMSTESLMPSSHLILCCLLLLSQIPPSIRVFSNESSQLFTWGGQSTGVWALASVLPMNTQDWSPLGWTGWISLQSKGLSRVFSNSTVQKCQFFCTQLSSPTFFLGGGEARIPEWVASPFSRRSSWARDWSRVSHTVGRCFTIWATTEVSNKSLECGNFTDDFYQTFKETLIPIILKSSKTEEEETLPNYFVRPELPS